MRHYSYAPRVTLKLSSKSKASSNANEVCESAPVAINVPESAEREARKLLANEPFETFIAIGLNAKNVAMATWVVSKGTIAMTPVHPVNVFGPAVALMTISSIVVAHNRPSGDTNPSAEDLAVTKRLVEAGKILGIPIVDHLVVGERKCTSIRTFASDLFVRS